MHPDYLICGVYLFIIKPYNSYFCKFLLSFLSLVIHVFSISLSLWLKLTLLIFTKNRLQVLIILSFS